MPVKRFDNVSKAKTLEELKNLVEKELTRISQQCAASSDFGTVQATIPSTGQTVSIVYVVGSGTTTVVSGGIDGPLAGRTAYVDANYSGLAAPYFTTAAAAVAYVQALTIAPSALKPCTINSGSQSDGSPVDWSIFDLDALAVQGIYVNKYPG